MGDFGDPLYSYGDYVDYGDFTGFDPSYNYPESGIASGDQGVIVGNSDATMLPDPPMVDYVPPDLTSIYSSGVLAQGGAYLENGDPNLFGTYDKQVYGMESDYGPAEPGPTITLMDPPSPGVSSTSGNMSKNPGSGMSGSGMTIGGSSPKASPGSGSGSGIQLPRITIGASPTPSNPRGYPTVVSRTPDGVPAQTNPALGALAGLGSTPWTGLLIVGVLGLFLLQKQGFLKG
jgi:hypothetical protein